MEIKYKSKIKNILSVLLILLITIPFSGCIDGELDVSRLMEKPLTYTMPIGKHVEDRFWGEEPQLMSEYTEYYIDINPTFGKKLRISQVEILPQLIMEAYKDKDNIVQYDFKQKFDNQITVYNDSNQKELELELASDGTIYARLDKDSPVLRFPEYVYYALEGALWYLGDENNKDSEGNNYTETCSSLIEPLTKWSPSMGQSLIELRLEHDIKTMLYIMYGYSDAVFVNYKIYSTKDLDRQYKVYMLLSYEGYEYKYDEEEEKEKFWPRYGEVIPVQLVYSWVEGNLWAITDMKFATYNDYNKLTEDKIRKVLPFLDTQSALDDLDDTSLFKEDLERQAMEYLSSIGKGDIEVDERK